MMMITMITAMIFIITNQSAVPSLPPLTITIAALALPTAFSTLMLAASADFGRYDDADADERDDDGVLDWGDDDKKE